MGGCLTHESQTVILIPYDGKFSQGETFANFKDLWLFAKVFSAKFGRMASFGCTSE